MTSKIYALHGLRAVAAVLVAITHLIMRLIDYQVVGADWQRFLIAGKAGVYTFFAVSGLIMIKSSLAHFGKPGAPWKFILRRLIRIVPIYYVFTLLFIVRMTMVGEPWSAGELLMSFLFIPYVNPTGLMQPLYGLGWTLNYEMFFYAIFALSLFLTRRLGLAVLFTALVAVVGLGLAWGQSLPNGDPQDLLAFYGHPIILFFIAGMLIGLAPVPVRLSPKICLLLASALLLGAVLISDPTLTMICCVAAVWVVSCEKNPETIDAAERSMEFLGEASYSIYLTHSFVLGPAVAIGLRLGLFGTPVGAWGYSVVVIGACVVAGALAYVVLERPLLSIMRRKLLGGPGKESSTREARA